MLKPNYVEAADIWVIAEEGTDYTIGATFSSGERAQREADRLNLARAQRGSIIRETLLSARHQVTQALATAELSAFDRALWVFDVMLGEIETTDHADIGTLADVYGEARRSGQQHLYDDFLRSAKANHRIIKRFEQQVGWRISQDNLLDEGDKSERITVTDGLVLRWSEESEVWSWLYNGGHKAYGSLAAAVRDGHDIIGKRRA